MSKRKEVLLGGHIKLLVQRTTSSLRVVFWTLNLFCLTEGLSFPKLHFGRCPDIQVQQDFNVPLYMGKWYQLGGYNAEWVEGDNSRCVTAQYQLDNTSGVISVHNMAIDNKTNKSKGIKGTAELADTSKTEAKLVVTFNIGWYGDVHGKYWVLGTDYNNLSVVYACNNIGFLHFYTVWILSRNQFLESQDEQMFFNRTSEIMRSHGLDPTLIQHSQQANCVWTSTAK